MSIETDRVSAEMEGQEAAAPFRKFEASDGDFRWDGISMKRYKEEGTTFKDVTRQTLFSGGGDQACELRYFEIRPGGHSTLEQHVHTHVILILRGKGRVLVEEEVLAVQPYDLLHVPSNTWHQLRADSDDTLGFLCLVPCDRDRPIRPDETTRAELLSLPGVREFIRL